MEGRTDKQRKKKRNIARRRGRTEGGRENARLEKEHRRRAEVRKKEENVGKG